MPETALALWDPSFSLFQTSRIFFLVKHCQRHSETKPMSIDASDFFTQISHFSQCVAEVWEEHLLGQHIINAASEFVWWSPNKPTKHFFFCNFCSLINFIAANEWLLITVGSLTHDFQLWDTSQLFHTESWDRKISLGKDKQVVQGSVPGKSEMELLKESLTVTLISKSTNTTTGQNVAWSCLKKTLGTSPVSLYTVERDGETKRMCTCDST